MGLPASVRAAVSDAVGAPLSAASPVAGGCINHGCRVEVADGRRYFLKWNASPPPGMFEAEAQGLGALRAAVAQMPSPTRPHVPEPAALGGGEAAWILMEWIEPEAEAGAATDDLGRALALLHDVPPDPDAQRPFGWTVDNFIGTLPQANRRHASWADFWRDERIAPRLSDAREAGHFRDALMDDLVDAIPAALAGVVSPSLLHGDLWGGNTFVAHDGRAALVDPAVYRGDGEVDLAMTELFGGFGAGFYDAYREVRPASAEYGSHRRALYQLYYLLVHVNLFGRSYVAGCEGAARTVLAAVG